MNNRNWETLLLEWSEKLVPSLADELSELSWTESLWIGYPRASQKQISEAEMRIGVKLPNSYKEFLLVSNGWGRGCPSYWSAEYKLWPVENINWFCERRRDWIDSWMVENPNLPIPSIPDSEYFNYDKSGKAMGHARIEYMEDLLEISDEGDDAILLLNPRVISGNGEWESWFLANWLGGAYRYRSFKDMMLNLYQEC